jgi:F0F1-type ATP synthase membrane subunit b/b'
MTTDLPPTRREHRQTRRNAERRRAGAQREIKQLQRDARRDLRAARRSAQTATIVGRARLAELAAQALTGFATRLHTSR